MRVLAALFLPALFVACSTAASPTNGPDAGYCESNGYASPSGGACAKGTCMAQGTSVPCCGSLCPTCESKGLVSYNEAGVCPPNLCPSSDPTATLQCCDTCGPLGGEPAAEAGPDVAQAEAGVPADASAQ